MIVLIGKVTIQPGKLEQFLSEFLCARFAARLAGFLKEDFTQRERALIGALSLIGASLMTYDQCAYLINFGALLAFTLVNLASIREYYFKAANKGLLSFFKNFLPPAIGAIACLVIWKSLPMETFIFGGSFLAVGLIYLVKRTRFFREKLEVQDVF